MERARIASIREKSKGQWHAQIRLKGWPVQSKTLRTKKQAQAWARDVEAKMGQSLFKDIRPAQSMAFKELIILYCDQVTANRPSKDSCKSETLRLNRLM